MYKISRNIQECQRFATSGEYAVNFEVVIRKNKLKGFINFSKERVALNQGNSKFLKYFEPMFITDEVLLHVLSINVVCKYKTDSEKFYAELFK